MALATPAIALLGIAIGWAQWTTARWKLILDLYEHRRQVYSDLRGPVGKVLVEGKSDTEDVIAVGKVLDQAQFLFGSDVKDYITELQRTLGQLKASRRMANSQSISDEQRQKHIEIEHKCLTKITEHYEQIVKLMVPYMLMDQKRPWSIFRLVR